MNPTKRNLPDYNEPPLVEVAVSVQFERISTLSSAHLGLLWERYRDRYPIVEEHPTLEPVVERFGQTSAGKPALKLEFVDTPAIRLWLLNKDKDRLIQIQRDRFGYNWRKTGGVTGVYPRYESVRKEFLYEASIFEQYIADERLSDDLQPNQCEITYVNHIEPGQIWKQHGELHKVMNLWTEPSDADVGNMPEEAQFSVRYVITGENGQPQGRLRISLEPAYRLTNEIPIFVLKITARGKPETNDFDSVLKFLDKGHELIVRSFTSVTTPQMHKVWDRKI